MKRFIDYKVTFASKEDAANFIREVYERSQKSENFKVDEEKGLSENKLFVKSRLMNLPDSNIFLMRLGDCEFSIPNIVPLRESSVSELTKDQYNQILKAFIHMIIDKVLKDNHWNCTVETNDSEYSLESVIPHSIEYLTNWLNHYPLSSHIMDRHRWFDFLIALKRNNESLSLSQFEDYLREEQHWDYEDVNEWGRNFERELDLVVYIYGRNH